MTDEELKAREAIRHTMSVYSIAGDAFDADTYLTCFTEDAVLAFTNFPGMGDLRMEGRAAIGEFVTGWFAAVTSGAAPLPGGFMRHHITTCRIDLEDADHARAHSYCIEFNRNGAEHCGTYTDQFRREQGRWLIASRTWTPDN